MPQNSDLDTFYLDDNQTISSRLRESLYFNSNKYSGRWCFSSKPKKICDLESIDSKGEWDNDIKMLILNVTDRCNLNCVYCSRQFSRKKPRSMTAKLLKSILHKSFEYAKEKNIEITLQFHGGEPILEFTKLNSAICQTSAKMRDYFKLRIQTNGTLLNDDIIRECCKNRVEIGISLDGKKLHNDLLRVDDRSLGTFNSVIDGLRKIARHQKELNCLTVVTNINVQNLDEILIFFDSMGMNNIAFLPLYEERRTPTLKKDLVPDLKTLASNQKKLFDEWLTILEKKKDRDLNITTFQILIWNLLSSNTHVKKLRVNCGVGVNSLFIAGDGGVWGCGAFSNADHLKLGDIRVNDLFEIQNSISCGIFKSRITNNTLSCMDCAFQHICKGGCIANAYKESNNIFDTDIWCGYWREIIGHILFRIYENPKLLELIPTYNIKRNENH